MTVRQIMNNFSTQQDVFNAVKGIQDIQSDKNLNSPMTHEQSEFLLYFIRMELSGATKSVKEILESNDSTLNDFDKKIKNELLIPMLKKSAVNVVFIQRMIDCHLSNKISALSAIFIMITLSTPASSSIWIYSLAKLKHHTPDDQMLDLNYLCEKLFPFGLPLDVGLDMLWDNQKEDCHTGLNLKEDFLPHGISGNIIDYTTCYN